MASVGFDMLVQVYRRTEFEPEGAEGSLPIDTSEVEATLRILATDEAAARDAGVVVLSETEDLRVGAVARVLLNPPKPALGFLARTMDDLLLYAPNRIEEPHRFFVVEGRFDGTTFPTPEVLSRYREVLGFVHLLGKAAAYLDPTRFELMFLRDGRLPMPIRFDAATLGMLSLVDVAELRDLMGEESHRDQKLSILADAVATMAAPQPPDLRFRHIVENLPALLQTVRDGYRLFASEFSFEKIRDDVEDARLDYLGKIHKTFIDIQGQLLGLPIATVVVASQFKAAATCGAELWTDVAVLGGAWLFVLLLLVAVVNQHMTLSAIAGEMARQRTAMATKYAAIAPRFADIFDGLDRRVRWHRLGMRLVAGVALLGAAFASLAFFELVDVNALECVAARHAASATARPRATAAAAAPTAAAGAQAGRGAEATRGTRPSRRDE